MSPPREVYLPDPLVQWPWQRTLNPYYADVKPESDTWVRGFEAIDAKSQRAFDLCNFCEPWTLIIFLQATDRILHSAPLRSRIFVA